MRAQRPFTFAPPSAPSKSTASQYHQSKQAACPPRYTHPLPYSTCRTSKRLLAAAIHKKAYIYEIAAPPSAGPVRVLVPKIPLPRLDSLPVPVHHQVAIFEGHNGNITSVCFHSEGKWLVTGSEDGTIKIWDLRYVPLPFGYSFISGRARAQKQQPPA